MNRNRYIRGISACLMCLTLWTSAPAAQESTSASADLWGRHAAISDTTVRRPEASPVVRRLDKIFEGRWSFRVIDHRVHEGVVVVLGELSAGGNTRHQFGSARLKTPASLGEAVKAAALDALAQGALLFDIWSDPDTTAVASSPPVTETPPATNGPPEPPVVRTVNTASVAAAAPETWFDPATTRYVGTPMEPEVIDAHHVDFNRYNLEAVRISTPLRLDGNLDEPVWRHAPAAAGFRQRDPNEGHLDTQDTEIRVLYDAENLYLGIMCYDRRPQRVVATEMRRDEIMALQDDDIIEFYIAPYGPTGDSYYFVTNPLGARGDALTGPGGDGFNMDWDATWQSYGKRHSIGWSAEVVLPFKVFRFNPQAKQDWAINFQRNVQRTRASAFWMPVSRADGQASRSFDKGGRIVGLEGIRPGRALEMLPYTVMGAIGDRRAATGGEQMNFDMRRDAGLDLKWGITSNITADATVNPDFAQIEADREVVNLSRFEFRFDEKRPFFLEGATTFNFGGGGGFSSPSSLPIFFSRRIGTQLSDGSTVRILHGEKVSGKSGGMSFGALNVHTEETAWTSTESRVITVADTSGTGAVTMRDTLAVSRSLFTEPETNWNVFRLRQDLFSRSTIGIMGLMKEPEDTPDGHTELPGLRFSDTGYNRVIGGDLRLQFNSTEHQFNILAARSFLPEAELHSRVLASNDSTLLNQNALPWAGAITHSWRNAWFSARTSYTDIRAGFFSDMGFVTRRDIRQAEASIGMNNLLRKWGIRSVGSSTRGFGNLLAGRWITNHRGGFFDGDEVESWTVETNPGMELENGVQFKAGWERNFDRLDQATEIANVLFPAGAYTFDVFSAEISTDRGKPVSIEGTYEQGDFYDGARRTIDGSMTWKPTYRMRIGLDMTYNRLERPQAPAGSWYDERWIPRFRVNYSFSPDMFISTFMQVNANRETPDDDPDIKALVSNFLFAYTMPQGHTFFVAYNQLTDDEFDPQGQRPLRPAAQAVVAKFSYLFNL